MTLPMFFSAPTGTSTVVNLISNLGEFIGDPFGREESEFDGKVVASTVEDFPVSINKNMIGEWVTKAISTDEDKIKEHFKSTNKMMDLPVDAADTTFPVFPPVPTRLALFCLRGRVTYARLADKITQYEELEDDHAGIKALLKPLKEHCLAACQMKNKKKCYRLQLHLCTMHQRV